MFLDVFWLRFTVIPKQLFSRLWSPNVNIDAASDAVFAFDNSKLIRQLSMTVCMQFALMKLWS